MLDNREWASLLWLGVAFTSALVFVPSTRTTLRSILRLLVGWKLLLPILVVGGSIVGTVTLAARIEVWVPGLAGDTVVTGFSVFALMFAFDRAAKEPHFMRHAALDAVRLVVFLEAFVNLRVFNLVVEILIQPVLALVLMLSAVAESKPEYRSVKKLLDVNLACFGFAIAGFVAWDLITQWESLTREDALAFALPIWLVLASLPAVYAVWLFAAYDSAFVWADFTSAGEPSPSWRIRIRSRLALLVALRGNVRDVNSISGYAGRRIREAASFREAVAAARQARDDRVAREAAKQAAARRLVDNAGVTGADQEGRRLDQREFEETKRALRWIATCHMGWYDRKSRYRKGLLDMLDSGGTFETYGLPAQHGITMRVSGDGQRWFAQRQTITGWWFAIGSSAPPPNQWEYDGPTPPAGFPGLDPSWGQSHSDYGPNW